jgi:MSHA biogenesis protein MshP
MINFRSVQQSTLVYGVQGARAMSAARTGLEWGIYQAISNDDCPTSDLSFNTSGAGSLDTFSIDVTCSVTSHFEGLTEVKTFQLTSSAEVGTFGTLDYVYRSLQASVSVQPP